MQGRYRGYSSHEYAINKTFSINDVACVQQDLLSHIYTRRGDRVMMPTFGTRIPDLAFEPLDSFTLMVLEEDLRLVVGFDPRVKLIDLKIVPLVDSNTIVASLTLQYIELNMVGNVDINIVVASA